MVHVFYVTLLSAGLMVMTHAGLFGQCVMFELSEEEEAFLTRATAEQANLAVWNDAKRGRLHCHFGLDTIVWREGRLDSLIWGVGLNVADDPLRQVCGVYEGASTWIHKGEFQLFGHATSLSSGMDWLSCSASTGWQTLLHSGDAPDMQPPYRCARLDNSSMLFFGDDGCLCILDLSTQCWTELGDFTKKFAAYLGEFSVIDLSDFILVFGDLGGGLIRKSTMKFVTNYELKRDLLTSARSWFVNQNMLWIDQDGISSSPMEVLFDAESMYVGGGSMDFMVPIAEDRAVAAKMGSFDWAQVAMGVGLGALMAGFFFWKKRDDSVVATPAVSPVPSATPNHKEPTYIESVVVTEAVVTDTGKAISSRRKPNVEDAKSVTPRERSIRVAPSKSRRRLTLEELKESLVSEAGSYTAAELNSIFGIELDASEDSQRARRARMVKQLNELSVAETGKKLIVRERDPNDRRHLLYRINKEIL